jgi:MoxR-like ATPase
VRLAAATREHPAVRYGASVRGSIALIRAARALAAFDGRNFVTPDDVKAVAGPVLAHRLVLTPKGELAPGTAADVVAEVLDTVAVPSAPNR